MTMGGVTLPIRYDRAKRKSYHSVTRWKPSQRRAYVEAKPIVLKERLMNSATYVVGV